MVFNKKCVYLVKVVKVVVKEDLAVGGKQVGLILDLGFWYRGKGIQIDILLSQVYSHNASNRG